MFAVLVSKRKAGDDCVEAAAGDGGLVAKIIEFVKAELAGNDASHDFRHIERVHALARTIAAEEGVAQDVVEIGALLHDVQVGLASFAAEHHSHRPATPAHTTAWLCALAHMRVPEQDWKYSGSEHAGVEAAEAFLTAQNYDGEKLEMVKKIIKGVGATDGFYHFIIEL
jgi:hypothetical protein